MKPPPAQPPPSPRAHEVQTAPNRAGRLSPAAVIQVKDLVKTFGALRAVDGISFHVERGEIFAFLGPNGAGKTTTLNILEGLLEADRGHVQVLQRKMHRGCLPVKQRIGVQLQNTSLLPDLTVLEQVKLFSMLYACPLSRREAMALLDPFGLRPKADLMPAALSPGQRKRLALALALVNDPEIIFLDEPSAGLDPRAQNDLWAMIRQLRSQGKTLLITTHCMYEAEALCDRIALMDRGRLVALGAPAELKRKLAGFARISTAARIPASLLARLPHALGVEYEGQRMSIQTDNPASVLGDLLAWADQARVNLTDLQVTQPGMQDVFLALTGRTIDADIVPIPGECVNGQFAARS